MAIEFTADNRTLSEDSKVGCGYKSSSLSSPRPFWLCELADDGTVMYSRSNDAAAADPFAETIEGRNFFEDWTGFENIGACRSHFQSFIKSNKAAASFLWRRSSERGSSEAKVLMTRAYQPGNCQPTGVVMMEIQGGR
jgi:TPR repeat protein